MGRVTGLLARASGRPPGPRSAALVVADPVPPPPPATGAFVLPQAASTPGTVSAAVARLMNVLRFVPERRGPPSRLASEVIDLPLWVGVSCRHCLAPACNRAPTRRAPGTWRPSAPAGGLAVQASPGHRDHP